jgi:hypothetical protein
MGVPISIIRSAVYRNRINAAVFCLAKVELRSGLGPFSRGKSGPGAHPPERRQDDAVRQVDRADPDRSKKFRHGDLSPPRDSQAA